MGHVQSALKFAADLAAVRAQAGLGPAADAAIAGLTGVPEALARLEASGWAGEAARLAAFALPRREAVWWACMCARHTLPPTPPAAAAGLLEATEAWVRRPTDEARRATMALAEAGPMDTPEAWAAVGAFWSGESMAPPGAPVVPPAPHLAGTAVAGAVALAAVRGDARRQAARLARFLDSARDIAGGGAGRLDVEAG
ncbi:DUF6931 family protein [Paracraurococcus lichenis]|uniref:Secreted protein n=1 Tax=Paracraurococcus lichenis TaxID=3064888 RepID=A0ABT9DXY1_9PROT|nr:hypothetical protein [Paracraurococcus sp. LOR1-02]MDO9708757.1 hypothetical protein [Paracraurococcus sp. LOR1-02]